MFIHYLRKYLAVCLLATTAAHAAASCVISKEGSLAVPGFTAALYTLDEPCTGLVRGLAIIAASLSAADRDGFADVPDITLAVGVPRDDSRYWQRSLSRQLAAVGIATLRYDALGVGCQPMEPVPVSRATPEHPGFSPFCIRPQETQRLKRPDMVLALQAAHQALLQHYAEPLVAQTVFIAHADSVLVANDYLQKSPAPEMLRSAALVAISPILSGASSNTVWRKIWRPTQLLTQCKAQPDSCVTKLLTDRIMGAVFSPNEMRTLRGFAGLPWEELKRRVDDWLTWSYRIESGYYFTLRNGERMMPFPTGMLLPSRTFSELHAPEHALVDRLQVLERKRLIFGTDDSVVSQPLQTERWTKAGGQASELQSLPGLGHWLGESPAWGPVSPRGMDAIRQAVIDLVDAAPVTQPETP